MVSEILYCRNLIYYLRSTICNYDCRCQKNSNFLLNLSSWVHNLVFTRDLLLIAVTKKYFRDFRNFSEATEYLIFQSVNKTLFTPACSLLDNSFCWYIVYVYILIKWCQERFQKPVSNRQTSLCFKCYQKFPINYYFTHY